ncbi:MAG: hypothetical protein A3F68_12885 [Acidobacteria bacterium RIFCSPLOWO2_12_FULL_54_10]|nr:MAG: hypothetical protein A3F68_12885 [Acidobacteria bacterium RIFCSPLOWO2_12_FULL_54_10]
MKKKVILLVATLGIFAILILGVRDIRRFTSSEPNFGDSKDGEAPVTVKFVSNPLPIPDFTVNDLDGKAISSRDWLGKVVLVNFWATWCPPCVAEIPDLIRMQDEYKDNLLIIGLSKDILPAADVKRFAMEHGINYPLAFSTPGIEAMFGGVVGLPTSFVVDTEGRIVQKHIGLRSPELYIAEIRALSDLPINAKIETFEDTGQIFLANAKNATELPGIDLTVLSTEQKETALRQLNEQSCTCGCGLTLAQCRINDTSCPVSLELAQHLVLGIQGANQSPSGN